MHSLVATHVAYVYGGVVAAIAADYLVIEVTPHVTVVLGFEQSGVAAQLAFLDVRVLADGVFLESMLLEVVDVLEGAEAVLAQVAVGVGRSGGQRGGREEGGGRGSGGVR